MRLSEIIAARGEPRKATKFRLQSAVPGTKNWEDLSKEPVTREEATEFLEQNPDEHLMKYRALGVDTNETLYRADKPDLKSTLARHAPPEVHKRNEDFFKKYL